MSPEQGRREPDEIRAEIRETRVELGETVAAVAEKADVKQQARHKADELREQAGAKVRELSGRAKEFAPESAGEGVDQAQRVAKENPVQMALLGTFLAGVVVGRLLSR